MRILILAVVAGLACCLEDEETVGKDPVLNYASLENSFRMAKVNLVWEKARLRLDHSKLKLLHHELRIHDKEELALKKIKSEDGDSEGLREAEIRKRFNSILNHYGLSGSGPKQDQTEEKHNLRVSKTKKLDRLWEKAKSASRGGDQPMSDEELAILKREFQHYQDKQNELNRLMEISGKDPSVIREHRRQNAVDDDDYFDEDGHIKHINALQEEGDTLKKDLKRHYHKLKKMATGEAGSFEMEFEEPKVQGLWRMAQEAEFSPEELDSLRIELKHYEARVQKLHVRAEISYMDERGGGGGVNSSDGGNDDEVEESVLRKRMDKKMRRHKDDVDQVHVGLERKIFARHSEL